MAVALEAFPNKQDLGKVVIFDTSNYAVLNKLLWVHYLIWLLSRLMGSI
jgi:hypothetical protein